MRSRCLIAMLALGLSACLGGPQPEPPLTGVARDAGGTGRGDRDAGGVVAVPTSDSGSSPPAETTDASSGFDGTGVDGAVLDASASVDAAPPMDAGAPAVDGGEPAVMDAGAPTDDAALDAGQAPDGGGDQARDAAVDASTSTET